MKKLVFSSIVIALLFSCSQDNSTPSPVAIIPTPNPNPTPTSTTFQDMQGLWYPSYTKTTGQATIYNSPLRKVELTNTLYNTMPGYYTSFGVLHTGGGGGYNYPDATYYRYDTTTNKIIGAVGAYTLVDVTIDSLNLCFTTNPIEDGLYYTRTPHNFGTTANVNWKVNLVNPYPVNGEVLIRIYFNSVTNNNDYIDIPITTGQTTFSGTVTVNLQYSNPQVSLNVGNVAIDINPTPSPLPPSNLIEFSTELSYGGVKASRLSEIYCVSYTSTPFDCQGYPPLSSLTTLQWDWN